MARLLGNHIAHCRRENDTASSHNST